MTRLNLTMDRKMSETLSDLRNHYHVENDAQLLNIAVKLLKLATKIKDKHGELIARQDGKDTKILIHGR